MSSVKRAHSKLLKSGFLPQSQTDYYECWINTSGRGTISFYKSGDSTDAFKVHGNQPDRPEVDEFNSYYTGNLSQAIRMSRI
jgi:hypothetical protein